MPIRYKMAERSIAGFHDAPYSQKPSLEMGGKEPAFARPALIRVGDFRAGSEILIRKDCRFETSEGLPQARRRRDVVNTDANGFSLHAPQEIMGHPLCVQGSANQGNLSFGMPSQVGRQSAGHGDLPLGIAEVVRVFRPFDEVRPHSLRDSKVEPIVLTAPSNRRPDL